jgi:hypothetical protein
VGGEGSYKVQRRVLRALGLPTENTSNIQLGDRVRIFSSTLVFLTLVFGLGFFEFTLQTEACAKDELANQEDKATKQEQKADKQHKSESKSMDSKSDVHLQVFVFTQTGGFIGVNRRYEKPLSELSEDERNQLEKLIGESGLLKVKDEQHFTAGAADMFHYDFRFTDGKQEYHAAFDDGSLPDSYRPLVKFAKPKAVDEKRH